MEDQQAQEAPSVFEALQEPLLEALQETDAESPVQNENLSWRTFALVGIYYFIAGLKSGRCLLTHLQHADPTLGLPTDLKKSTFFEAFRRFRGEQARQLFYAVLSGLSFFPVEEMAALGILCAVDGSHWPALFRMSWALVGENKPTVLLHLAFGLNQMIPVGMLLTESNSSERNALKQMLQRGVTYVADRGYFAYYLLLDIAAAAAFFVIRAPGNVTYEIVTALPVQLPSGVNWLFDVQDLKVFCDKGEHSGTWRVVRFIIGQSQFVLFTNRWELTTWQIITIYAYRWQIELLFLFLKRTLNGLHLLTYSRNGLQIQFYFMLIAAILLLHFKQRNDTATAQDAPEPEPVQVPLPSVQATALPQPASPTEAVSGHSEVASSPAEEKISAAEPVTPADEEPKAQGADQPPVNTLAVAEPTGGQKEPPSSQTKPARTKNPTGQPTRQGTIEDDHNAQWYRDLGKRLATFWRISVHWLQTLRDNLARPWNPAVFTNLAGYAKPRK